MSPKIELVVRPLILFAVQDWADNKEQILRAWQGAMDFMRLRVKVEFPEGKAVPQQPFPPNMYNVEFNGKDAAVARQFHDDMFKGLKNLFKLEHEKEFIANLMLERRRKLLGFI
jgi:hypothetical protein